MTKAKYSVELKVEIVKEYEAGKGSYKSLAEKCGVRYRRKTTSSV